MKSVFIFTPTLDGGVGRIVTNIAKGLAERNFKITLVAPALEGDFARTIGPGVVIHSFGKNRVSECIFQLSKLLKDSKPDVLISLSFHANCVAVLSRIFSRDSNIKLIICEHINLTQALKSLSLLKRALMRASIFLFYRHADSLVAVSMGARDSMSHFSRVNVSRIDVIYNPVIDQSFYDGSQNVATNPFFSEHTCPVLVTVGRLDYQKDLKTLLDAFAYLLKDHKARLIICGDGPLKSDLESQARELGISEDISFVGFVKNPLSYMKQADVFVLSSIYEGLPTVLIEALAVGASIVSTDCPDGPREILKGGEYGRLVAVGNPLLLSKAIASALDEGNNLKADQDYIKKFTIPVAVEEYIRVINKALSA